jgi:hypothetical protein
LFTTAQALYLKRELAVDGLDPNLARPIAR